MRFIDKSNTTPSIISDWLTPRRSAGQSTDYADFNKKKELNNILREEQHDICCYCQRRISHYRPNYKPNDPLEGAHNEHLYPENRPNDPRSHALQMDYYNIFACCVDSQGHKKREKHLRYCGEAKGNEVIREFLKEKDCQRFFRYLLTGEIIPNGMYHTWKEYADSTTLSKDEEDARRAIVILNLNCSTLRDQRKDCINAFFSWARTRSKNELIQTKTQWLTAKSFPPFIELRLQLIDRLIQKLP